MANVIDLSQTPAPDVVEALDYETVRSALIADLRARAPDFDALVESDPAVKVLEVAAYRETILRQRVNEAAQAVMLPYAAGADLDNLATLFGVTRLVTQAAEPDANPPIPEKLETDTELRRRVQLSLDGLSVAGPAGAYVYHALSADGRVLDASAASPSPGAVVVSVLARDVASTAGDGSADQSLLETVEAAVSAEDVRPLTDHVTVATAEIVAYEIQATLYTFEGPDSSVVVANARAAVADYVADTHRLGRDVALSAVYAALSQPGVQHVELARPGATIAIDATQAPYCSAIEITYGGIDT